MLFVKSLFSEIKTKALVLIILYVMGTAGIIITNVFQFEQTILLHSLFFAIVVIINRLSAEFHVAKQKMMPYIYATELCFIIYLFLVFFLDEDYFRTYKLLVIPGMVLSIVQAFGFRKSL